MRLHPIAASLARSGHRVVLASRRRQPAERMFSDLLAGNPNVELIPSPPLEAIGPRQESPSHTLADVLFLFGYTDAKTLFPAAARWSQLLGKVSPDLIAADFAPTLTLVARDRVPMVTVGSGYTIPPRGSILPPIRPWDRETPFFSKDNEQRILEACSRLGRANTLAPVKQVAELFRGNATFPCTFPILDPYGRHRRERLWLPMSLRIEDGVARGTRTRGNAAFLYLPAKHPFVVQVLTSLVKLRWQVTAYIEGDRSGLVLPEEVQLLPERPDLNKLLRGFDIVVHHGGSGTAHAALLAGVPQLVFPLWLEDHVTSHILARLGVARAFSASEPLEQAALEEAIVTLDARAAAALGANAERDISMTPHHRSTTQAVMEAAVHFLGGVSSEPREAHS